jgi:hypothetical protein
VTALAHWPSIVHARGHGGAARPLLIAAVTFAAVVAATVLRARRRATRDRPRPGGASILSPDRATVLALVLLGFGGAWSGWGMVDQHLLQAFDLTPGSAWAGAWDGLFHGVGVMTAGIGTWMVCRTRPDVQRRRLVRARAA